MSCPIIERHSDKNYIEKTNDVTPPNTTPSSISPLKMAIVTSNTLTDTSHTHKSTAQEGRGENAIAVDSDVLFLLFPSYGQQSLCFSLQKKTITRVVVVIEQ